MADGDSGWYCGPCLEQRLSGEKRTPTLVMAYDRFHDGYFHFACPACHKALRVKQVTPDDDVTCPNKKCGTPMRVMTPVQRIRQAAVQRERDAHIQQSLTQFCPDQIVVLGRPQSGKTVFLAALYKSLWGSRGDLSGNATDGASHAALLEHYQSMQRGEWPEGGQGTLQLRKHEWALHYRGLSFHLATMDYPGEVYRKVFFEKRVDTPECEALFRQVEAAVGVMLLVDPEHALRDDAEINDLEFSCLQVVEHMRERGLQDNLVIVLTKRDRNAALLESHGGKHAFLEKFMPRMMEAIPHPRVVSLCAMPAARDIDGKLVLNEHQQTIPAPQDTDVPPAQAPLRHLLDAVSALHLRFLNERDRRVIDRAQSMHPTPPPPTTTDDIDWGEEML